MRASNQDDQKIHIHLEKHKQKLPLRNFLKLVCFSKLLNLSGDMYFEMST